jgi:hypothetical protein
MLKVEIEKKIKSMRSRKLKKKIKKNHETQFSNNLILRDEFEEKKTK